MENGEIDWTAVGAGALIGGAVGLTLGAGASLIASGGTTIMLTAGEVGVGLMAIINNGGLNMFSKAAEYGIRTYNNLRNAIKGLGLQAHHIIEKRFADILKINPKDMLSVALTPKEHQMFTNMWRALIPYGTTASANIQKIWQAAQKIYADYPALLEAARITLFGE